MRASGPALVLLAVIALGCGGCTSPDAKDPLSSRPAPPVLTLQPAPAGVEDADALGITARPSRVRLRDPHDDVFRVVGGSTRTVRHSPLDLTRLLVVHDDGDVRVQLRFADLRPVGRPTFDVGFYTPAGLYFFDLTPAGTRVPRLPQEFSDPAGDQVTCPRFRRTVDPAHDLVAMAVPRSCLGTPAWVKVRVLLSQPTADGSLFENPHNSRPFSEFATKRLYPG